MTSTPRGPRFVPSAVVLSTGHSSLPSSMQSPQSYGGGCHARSVALAASVVLAATVTLAVAACLAALTMTYNYSHMGLEVYSGLS